MSEQHYQRTMELTVMTTPVRTVRKLKDCCVVLAAFSLRDKSAHRTLPSSLAMVICFRDDPDLLPEALWVAYLHRGTKNAGCLASFDLRDDAASRLVVRKMGPSILVKPSRSGVEAWRLLRLHPISESVGSFPGISGGPPLL